MERFPGLQVTRSKEHIFVRFPPDESFENKCRELGGYQDSRWNLWVFDSEHSEAVGEALQNHWGWNGKSLPEPVFRHTYVGSLHGPEGYCRIGEIRRRIRINDPIEFRLAGWDRFETFVGLLKKPKGRGAIVLPLIK